MRGPAREPTGLGAPSAPCAYTIRARPVAPRVAFRVPDRAPAPARAVAPQAVPLRLLPCPMQPVPSCPMCCVWGLSIPRAHTLRLPCGAPGGSSRDAPSSGAGPSSGPSCTAMMSATIPNATYAQLPRVLRMTPTHAPHAHPAAAHLCTPHGSLRRRVLRCEYARDTIPPAPTPTYVTYAGNTGHKSMCIAQRSLPHMRKTDHSAIACAGPHVGHRPPRHSGAGPSGPEG